MRGGAPHVVAASGLSTKNDANNVSLDREARLLAENTMRFNLAATLLKSQLRSGARGSEEGERVLSTSRR